MVDSESQDQRLNAFYTLLADVYGKPVKFGQLLTKPPISPNQVKVWITDENWKTNYLNKFLQSLIWELQINFPNINANIITLLYGLGDDKKVYSPRQIANQLNLAIQLVKDHQKTFMDFLKGDEGIQTIERLVIEAAQNDNRITDREQSFLIALYEHFVQNQKYPDNQWLKKKLNLTESGISNLKKSLREKKYLDPKFQNAVLTPVARRVLRSLAFTPPLEITVLGEVKAGDAEFEDVVTIQDVDNLTDLELDTISIPNTIGTDRQVYALKVSGKSMERENIYEGDFVVIQKCLPFERFKDGDLIVAKYLHKEKEWMVDLSDESWSDNISESDLSGPTLKRIYYGNWNLRIRHVLTPFKEDRDSEYVIQTWHVVPKGKVISVFRKITI